MRLPVSVAAWLAFCLPCGTVPARAQTAPARPITLPRKKASTLILAQVKPEYPPIAKVNYIQGKVRMQVLVSPQGRVTEANAVEGHPFLVAAALKAVRRWIYSPFMTDHGPVAFVTVVDVNFALRNSFKQDQLPPSPEEFLRQQVRPASLLTPPAPALETSSAAPGAGSTARGRPHSSMEHLRVLVGDDGRALDVNPIHGFPYQYEAVLKLVEQYQFRPARWGPLAVPWYLDMDVPAPGPSAPARVVLGR